MLDHGSHIWLYDLDIFKRGHDLSPSDLGKVVNLYRTKLISLNHLSSIAKSLFFFTPSLSSLKFHSINNDE